MCCLRKDVIRPRDILLLTPATTPKRDYLGKQCISLFSLTLKMTTGYLKRRKHPLYEISPKAQLHSSIYSFSHSRIISWDGDVAQWLHDSYTCECVHMFVCVHVNMCTCACGYQRLMLDALFYTLFSDTQTLTNSGASSPVQLD